MTRSNYCCGGQQVFDDAGDTTNLGTVFAARAQLEAQFGRPDRAADLERLALRYSYVQPEPEAVAVGHHNLASYLTRTGGDPAEWLAHVLAAAILFWCTTGLSDQRLAQVALALRSAGESAVPASFAQLQARVEQVEGVRFGQLSAALALDPGAGDDTVAQVLRAARDLPDDQAYDLQAHLDRWGTDNRRHHRHHRHHRRRPRRHRGRRGRGLGPRPDRRPS